MTDWMDQFKAKTDPEIAAKASADSEAHLLTQQQEDRVTAFFDAVRRFVKNNASAFNHKVVAGKGTLRLDYDNNETSNSHFIVNYGYYSWRVELKRKEMRIEGKLTILSSTSSHRPEPINKFAIRLQGDEFKDANDKLNTPEGLGQRLMETIYRAKEMQTK